MTPWQVIDVLANAETTKLTFDPEWLAITRAFQPFFNQGQPRALLPPHHLSSQLVRKHLEWVLEHVGEDRPVGSVQKFQPTAPGSVGRESRRQRELFRPLNLCFFIHLEQHQHTSTSRQRRSVTCYTFRISLILARHFGPKIQSIRMYRTSYLIESSSP